MVQRTDGAVVSTPDDTAAGIRFGRLSESPRPRLGELREQLEVLGRDQRDVVVPADELALTPSDGALMVGGSERYALREHAFGQLAAKLGIPANYLRRCDPDLRSRNVNRWLKEAGRDVMLRLEGGQVRAVLSGTYRPINHRQILDWLESRLGAETSVRFELTEGYLDLQVIGDAETGLPNARHDALNRGLHLRNSEVGLARVSISSLVFRQVCLNGLVLGSGRWAYHRRHVGRSELVDEVRDAFDRAFELSAQATTAFAGTRGVRVAEPEKALERVAQRYELTEDESTSVNRAFQVEPGDTLYHVINSLTRAGNDTALNVDSRFKLQGLGGRLTDLSATGRWLDN